MVDRHGHGGLFLDIRPGWSLGCKTLAQLPCTLAKGQPVSVKTVLTHLHTTFDRLSKASMNLRTILIALTVAAIVALTGLNWQTLNTAAPVSLGVTTVQAPLGLMLLALTALLAAFFVAYVLWLQGSVLLETRRHSKEMQSQRELADKAEASRFTEMKSFLQDQGQRTHAALMERIETLESRLMARATESDNTTAAYVGQVEHQLREPGRVIE